MALLTVVITLAHLLALGLTPAGMDTTATLPVSSFITRTIVLAPEPALKPPAPEVSRSPQTPPEPHAPSTAKPSRPAGIPPRPDVDRVMASPSNSTLQSELSSGLQPDVPAAADVPVAVTAAPAGVTPEASGPAGPLSGPATGPGTGLAAPGGGEAPASPPDQNAGTGTRAMKIPGSTRLGFSVSGEQGTAPVQGGYGELVWLQNGTDYDARLTLKLLFFTLLDQHSTGHVGVDGLAPDRFGDKRRNRAELAAHFLRDQGQVSFSNNKPDVPLRPGAQDRLSVMLQLGALLAGDVTQYPQGSTITVQTVGTGDGDVWTFNVEGDEALDLPAGSYQARKLSRSPRREFDDKIELWLAPSLGYLPVRLRVTQTKGDFYEIQLRSVSAAGPN